MTPTQIESLFPKEVVDAWWLVKIKARHIPGGGGSRHGDVQTLDCMPDHELVEVNKALDILRDAHLLKENLFKPKPKEFRRGEGNFVVLDLTIQHSADLIVGDLLGTCGSLDDKLEELGHDIGTYPFEGLVHIDSHITCCEECNWWVETCDLNEEDVCNDCST